jgi:proline racemase
MSHPIHWTPPENWTVIKSIEMHTGGEPLRIPVSGLPEIAGSTILEKRRYFRDHYDHLRTSLMFEPRGHADMYGAILTEPLSEYADFGTFFIHNEGYSTMCGHAIIALTKFAIETGMVKNKTELIIDAPPGLIRSKAKIVDKEVVETSFLNVPSFLLYRDEVIEVEGIGTVKFDVSYGGAFYAFVDADELGLGLTAENYNQLIDWGKKIKKAVMESYTIKHPFEEDLSFLYGTIFTGKAHDRSHHSRNVCIFAEGEVDRSATGSGVSARAALHHAKRELKQGEKITIESILGTTMDVEIKELASYGGHDAVIPEVTGKAWFCGKFEHWIDPNDPLKEGFIFR